MSSLKDKIAAQRKAIADRNAGFVRPYKFKEGKTVLRVLPWENANDEVGVAYGEHFIKDPATGTILTSVGDAGVCYGQPDPVREAVGKIIMKATDRGDDRMAGIAKDWLGSQRFAFNGEIKAGDPDNINKVVLCSFSGTLYDNLLSQIDTLIDADKDPWDLSEGLVVVVERTGTGVKDTKYNIGLYPNPAKCKSDPAVMEKRVDLNAWVDSKFGPNVTKALTALSAILGEDVTGTAIASAVASTALPSPASSAPSADADALLSLDEPAVVDAEVEPITQSAPTTTAAEAPAAAPAQVSTAEFDDIMADLENL